MTDAKNPAPTPDTEANELSEEELEAASGGIIVVGGKTQLNAALSSQQVIAPIDVRAGAMPNVKDSLL